MAWSGKRKARRRREHSLSRNLVSDDLLYSSKAKKLFPFRGLRHAAYSSVKAQERKFSLGRVFLRIDGTTFDDLNHEAFEKRMTEEMYIGYLAMLYVATHGSVARYLELAKAIPKTPD